MITRKRITKRQIARYNALTKRAAKLNNDIEKLFNETDNMDFCPNWVAISNHAFRTNYLMVCDMLSINKTKN